jgi:hypothetical protein
MSRKKPSREQEAAFVMQGGDRFHRILVADGVRFESAPGYETVLTFFVIRRAAGSFSIVNILKTFKGEVCQSRKVQTKEGVAADAIDREMDAVTGAFSQAIEAGSGKKLVWHTLDLSAVTDMRQQVQRIEAWGRVKAWMEEIPPEFTRPSVN